MTQAGYKQFCPLAMAAEVLCTRWTMVLMRELIAGSTRFNDLRRGVPKMSPTLLSQRLKELEAIGIVERAVYLGAQRHYIVALAGGTRLQILASSDVVAQVNERVGLTLPADHCRALAH